MKFKITSSGIKNNYICEEYGRKSGNIINGVPQISLPLKWSNYPAGTLSFAIILIDYDNCIEEGFPWIHWSVANIPATINSLDTNCSVSIKEIDSMIVQGKNTWISVLPKDNPECNRYGGPAPEKFSHEYELQVYALNSFLPLNDGFYYNEFLKSIKGKILDQTEICAVYHI